MKDRRDKDHIVFRIIMVLFYKYFVDRYGEEEYYANVLTKVFCKSKDYEIKFRIRNTHTLDMDVI